MEKPTRVDIYKQNLAKGLSIKHSAMKENLGVNNKNQLKPGRGFEAASMKELPQKGRPMFSDVKSNNRKGLK